MSLANLKQFEDDLWEAADQLRANSKLTSTEYCMPVLGIIFLRHAANRFNAAAKEIEADIEAGRMPRRPLQAIDFKRRRALMLQDKSRYEYLANLPIGEDLGDAIIKAMTAIEDSTEILAGVLPKDYGIFERKVLEDLVRTFDSEALRTASGDVFGRIYEYFLMKFAMQGAQDNGEFFTPPSIVQTIVNVIEPDHGVILDPACGSGGMFVQSSHFIENQGQDTAHKVTFYGQEKTATTIKLAKMNLAVHGLEGDIREANTFKDDVHELRDKCDFVMANPPFNVDMVSVNQVKGDLRLPFGLPGENKDKNVPNANYLWISYFYSYLNANGRSGFVMSSQASSAGNKEKDVREKIVKTGHVDVMIAIRSGFFYTRAVPCELWFFDKGKPEQLRDKVLMLDARNIHRKVTRTVYDFSPEQLSNLTAVVWLYRGQGGRFLELVGNYFVNIVKECEALSEVLKTYDTALLAVCEPLETAAKAVDGVSNPSPEKKAFSDATKAVLSAIEAYEVAREAVLKDIAAYIAHFTSGMPENNTDQHVASMEFAVIADALKSMVKQIDSLQKLVATAVATVKSAEIELANNGSVRALAKLVKELDLAREEAVDQLQMPRYFLKHILWLQERFPDAEYIDVLGLCKRTSIEDIEAADWSLTPGRYVGVAPQEEDEDFDFEEALREIHYELAGLNAEAIELALQIQANLEDVLL